MSKRTLQPYVATGPIKLTIADVPPSLNVQKRMHWATYAKLRRHWEMLIFAALAAERRLGGKPIPFARITFTRHSARLLDADNWCGACKPILDVLRPPTKSNPNGLSIIEDDDASHVVVTYAQARCPKVEARTVIEIERGAA